MSDECTGEIGNELDCCDTPDIRISSWKWDHKKERWNFDAICHSCWELCYGSVYAVDVEIRG